MNSSLLGTRTASKTTTGKEDEDAAEQEATTGVILNNVGDVTTTIIDDDNIIKNPRTVGVDINNVTLKDIDYDDEGNPTSVFGVSWHKLPVKQVRTICSKLGVKGVKNVKKSAMIDVLVKWCYSSKIYDDMRTKLGLTTNEDEEEEEEIGIAGGLLVTRRKEVQCAFRLMNIVKYKAALTRFTVSGTHDNNFFGFCNGKLEIYYLRHHLNRRPQLNGMVKAALPEQCFMSSEMPIMDLKRKLLLEN
jgi:hypothetical protein